MQLNTAIFRGPWKPVFDIPYNRASNSGQLGPDLMWAAR